MRTPIAGALAATLILAAVAVAEDAVPLPLVPEVPLEALVPAAPQAVDDETVTFDSMESIPFENAVEPPDDPPPIPSFDNSIRLPAPDNAALPAVPAPAPPAPGASPAPTPAAPPVPPSSFTVQGQ